MTTILIAITAISLGVTGLLSVLLVRVLREERRRSEARIRLLTELAAVEGIGAAAPATAFDDFELRSSEAAPVQIAALFDEHHQPSPWPKRFAAAGAFVVVMALAAFAWSVAGIDRAKPPAVTIGAAPPLELLSLTHQQEEHALTISGVVQNPRGADRRTNVEATALVYGADGGLLASGKARLDYAMLPPGDESPFVIRIPARGAARYRVSFRTADGQALPHVDRRTLDAVARKELPWDHVERWQSPRSFSRPQPRSPPSRRSRTDSHFASAPASSS